MTAGLVLNKKAFRKQDGLTPRAADGANAPLTWAACQRARISIKQSLPICPAANAFRWAAEIEIRSDLFLGAKRIPSFYQDPDEREVEITISQLRAAPPGRDLTAGPAGGQNDTRLAPEAWSQSAPSIRPPDPQSSHWFGTPAFSFLTCDVYAVLKSEMKLSWDKSRPRNPSHAQYFQEHPCLHPVYKP